MSLLAGEELVRASYSLDWSVICHDWLDGAFLHCNGYYRRGIVSFSGNGRILGRIGVHLDAIRQLLQRAAADLDPNRIALWINADSHSSTLTGGEGGDRLNDLTEFAKGALILG